jgi:hypothetical protein
MLLTFSSCEKKYHDTELDHALEIAGTNKSELVKVLDHYSDAGDSLKYKAAVFLIKYMPGKYAKVYPEYDLYKPIFDTIESLNNEYLKVFTPENFEFYKYYKKSVFDHFMDEHSVKKITDLHFDLKEDIKTITANYLIENIEYAFKVRQMPWNKNLSFSDFCEFILPYRYGSEELQPWRKVFFEKNKKLLDSFKNERDPERVAIFIKQGARKCQSELIDLKPFDNSIKPLDLIRINSYTSCYDETGQMLLRQRALGVPVTRINIPNWGNRGSGHDLMGVLRPKGKWRGFVVSGNDTNIYKPPLNFTITKAFAQIYSNNKNSAALITNKNNGFEPNLGCIDVTKYIGKTSNLIIPYLNEKDGTKAALCVFNNKTWIPIVSSIIYKGKAVFLQIGGNVIYLPGIIGSSGELQIKGNPFLLDSTGMVMPIVSSKIKNAITMDRKYPFNDLLNLLPTLNNCYFQGSNDADFKDAVTLWKITNLTRMSVISKTLSNSQYQYVRLVFPYVERKNEALSGIQLYNNKILLTGNPISSIKASKLFYNQIFDNDPLTFVKLVNKKFTSFNQYYNGDNLVINDQEIFWVGLKFKDKMNITKLEFSPRTDDNYVNSGEHYILYYWNNGDWMPTKLKQANSNKIEFDVPENSLYLLKNVDKGNEQRIFLYKNNKQIWY